MNYFVSKLGTDSHSGTRHQEWRSINKAKSRMAVGDTLRIEPGVYEEQLTGAWSSGVVIESMGMVIVRAPTGSHHCLRMDSDVEGVEIEGIAFDGIHSSSDVLKLTYGVNGPDVNASRGIRLVACSVYNGPANGIMLSDHDKFPSGHEIIDCDVHHNGTPSTESGQQKHGIYGSARGLKIEKCRVYSNSHYGIHLYGQSTNNEVIECRTWANGKRGITVSHGQNVLVQDNECEDGWEAYSSLVDPVFSGNRRL